MSVFKFTPGFMSGEQIDHISVGRAGLLSHSVEKICNAIRDGRTINMIFVGPRGIGKSHTALRLVYMLKEKATITPALLSEEEYSVSSLNEFFSKILHVLDESTTSDVVEHARKVFKTRRKEGKPVVILAENLQMLFCEMKHDLPSLRSIMLEDQSFFIVGTALSTFEQIESPSAAFYNFFEINKLQGLGASDINKLIKLRIEDGQSHEARTDSTINPKGLHILTGGNPRLVHMLCDVMMQKKSYVGLEDHLMDLLDRITPFYQTRMEIMSSEKRKVFDTLALSNGPSTPTEIATKLNFKNTVVTACMARLRSDGIVERVKLRQKKETRYQIIDRLYRIWREFRTRDGNTKTTAFVRFLELWYSSTGLINEYNLESHALESAPDVGKARSRLHTLRCILTAMSDSWVFLDDTIKKFVDKGDYRGAESTIKDFRAEQTDEQDSLLSICVEIIAKNAERFVISHDKCSDHTSRIFADMEKVYSMIKNHKDLSDDKTVHVVSKIIEYAINLKNLNLAYKINSYARDHFIECKSCRCFTHHQISIMLARNCYADALKTINDALSTKQDLGLIARRSQVHTYLGNKANAIQDAQLSMQSDDFLHVALFAYSRFFMFADVHKILLKKSTTVKSMEEKKRDYLVGRLLTDITSALQGSASGTKDADAIKCITLLKPYVTPDIVSTSPMHSLIEHSRGVESVGRALDTLFETLDRSQLGMLTVLKCAVDYARCADTDSLERLHPEQRELALEIISKISPDTKIPQEVYDSIK